MLLPLFRLALAVLTPLVAPVLACPASPTQSPAADAVEQDGRGVFLRAKGQERFSFHPWEGEVLLNRLLFDLKDTDGGELRFAPGVYTIHSQIYVSSIADMTISGVQGAVLQLAEAPAENPLTTMEVRGGERVLTVDRPDLMRAGWKYQLFPPHLGGDRLLEFHVTKIEGNEIHMHAPARIMPHVEEIPEGCVVLEQVKIFRALYCPGLVIENLELDGVGRGDIRGHTSLVGIHASGRLQESKRPITMGMTVRGCTFRNFNGRGIAAYGVGEVLIEGNSFENIRAEAIEIDHYSSGIVRGNHVDGAEIGVRINDAFESRVEGNMLRNCEIGIDFLMIVDKDWINTGNVALDNVIGPGCAVGINFASRVKGRAPWDNEVRGNLFVGLEDEQRVVGGEGNRVKQ